MDTSQSKLATGKDSKIVPSTPTTTTHGKTKSTFISYCQTPSELRERAHLIADRLQKAGIPTVIDKYDLRPGHDIEHFMQTLSTQEHYHAVLVLCTHEYKQRAENGIGGVGREAALIKPHVINQPNQTFVIPVLIEKGELADIMPDFFPQCTYYVDLSSELSDENLASLVSVLNGTQPRKPPHSQLETAVFYALANYPGLPDSLKPRLRRPIIEHINFECRKALDFVIGFEYWSDASESERALERISTVAISLADQLGDDQQAVDLLSMLWKFKDFDGDNDCALEFAIKAIDIAQNGNAPAMLDRRLAFLKFQLGQSLHRLKRLPEALETYNELLAKQCQSLLPVDVLLFTALYAGHVARLTGDISTACGWYRGVVETVDDAVITDIPDELRPVVLSLKYRALLALAEVLILQGEQTEGDKCKSHADKLFATAPELRDKSFGWKLTNGLVGNSLFPDSPMKRVRCIR